jgi:hypothetical protein
VCALPTCWNRRRIICWHCYTGQCPHHLHRSPCRQYTTASRHHSQNRGHNNDTSGHFVEDGEHVRWHHLPKHAWSSPRSLRPTATVCCPIATVYCPAATVCRPSTSAIFHSAATKLYCFCCPQLSRPSTRAKMLFRQMPSNDQGLPMHSRLHQLQPLQTGSNK